MKFAMNEVSMLIESCRYGISGNRTGMEYFTDTVIELILKFWSHHKTDGTVHSLTMTLNLTI